MLKALFYCHRVVKIVHRDIKPANIAIDHNKSAVLIDFGIASIREDDDILKHAAGSIPFYAPEMFDKNAKLYGEKQDLWALGVTLFYMTQGKLPFDSEKKGIQGQMEIRDKILNEEIDFDDIDEYELKDLLE